MCRKKKKLKKEIDQTILKDKVIKILGIIIRDQWMIILDLWIASNILARCGKARADNEYYWIIGACFKCGKIDQKIANCP